MGIAGKCRTDKPDSRFDESVTWCPVLFPVLAHWSEDLVMLNLQAKSIKKSARVLHLREHSHGSFKWCGDIPCVLYGADGLPKT